MPRLSLLINSFDISFISSIRSRNRDGDRGAQSLQMEQQQAFYQRRSALSIRTILWSNCWSVAKIKRTNNNNFDLLFNSLCAADVNINNNLVFINNSLILLLHTMFGIVYCVYTPNVCSMYGGFIIFFQFSSFF